MKTRKKTKTGNLRIGNQWNAINIIARSQTHPLKAVCELVENAIDAKATVIHTCSSTSRRQKMPRRGRSALLESLRKRNLCRSANSTVRSRLM